MDKNSHYKPDYHLLNRKARLHNTNDNNDSQAAKLLNRFFYRGRKTAPNRQDLKLFEKLSVAIRDVKLEINWEQDLFDASYVVFDTETTGFHPYKGDEIISLGAVVVENNRILNEPVFYQLINPGRPVPPQAQKITGLTDDMLDGKPEIIPVLLEFMEFCGPRILVAHNAPFDLAFINCKIGEAIERRIVNPVIDTALLCSALFYSIGDYSLENLAAHFQLNLEGRHNALGDARIAAELFLKLLPELQIKGITSLPRLAQLFSELDLTKGYPLIF